MAAQKGSALLIKIGDGVTPTEGFTTLAGLRTKSLSFNSEQVDVTTADSTDRWRELLTDAGVKSMSCSGSGVFTDTANDEKLRADAFAGTKRNFEVVVPGLGTFKGPFQIATVQYTGEHNGESAYEVGLESAGAITFTAAA